MARPRAFDEGKVVDQAMRLFWHKGFTATSTRDLSLATGLGAASLYGAFGSKEALFMAALDRYARLFGAPLAEVMDRAPTARSALDALLSARVATLADPSLPRGCLVVNTVLECGADSSEAIMSRTAERVRALDGAIARRLRRAQAEGEIAESCELSSLAGFYGSVVQGLAVRARAGADREALSGAARLAAQAWDRLVIPQSGSQPADVPPEPGERSVE